MNQQNMDSVQREILERLKNIEAFLFAYMNIEFDDQKKEFLAKFNRHLDKQNSSSNEG